MTASASEIFATWRERHGEAWRERGVRHAGRWARIVINHRLGLRSGMSRGPWSLGTGDLNGRSRASVDQERRDEIRAQVDSLLDELGLSKPEDPLRRVGQAMREVVLQLDVATAPVSPSDLDLDYEHARGGMRKLEEHGFARRTGEEQRGRWWVNLYVITDEGRKLASLVREREAETADA